MYVYKKYTRKKKDKWVPWSQVIPGLLLWGFDRVSPWGQNHLSPPGNLSIPQGLKLKQYLLWRYKLWHYVTLFPLERPWVSIVTMKTRNGIAELQLRGFKKLTWSYFLGTTQKCTWHRGKQVCAASRLFRTHENRNIQDCCFSKFRHYLVFLEAWYLHFSIVKFSW